jgi:3'-5' exoribonuclease
MPVTIEDGKPFSGLFLLKAPPSERLQKDGKPYLALTLGTPAASYDAKMWSTSLAAVGGLAEGDPVRAEGSAERYQGRLQLRLTRVAREAAPVDPRELYPSSARSEADLRGEFRARVKALRDPWLKSLLAAVEADAPFLASFFRSPAASGMHHARIGGLAEHSLAAAAIAARTAETYPLVRADLAVAGALLHDVGKVREYDLAGDFRFTREGHFIGHIALGALMLEGWTAKVPGFPADLRLDLVHILLSHHGQAEMGSPREPVTAEALLVHFADDLDAKLDMIAAAAGGGSPGVESGYVRGLRRTFFFAPGAAPDLAIEAREEGPPPASGGRGGQGGLFE